MESHYLEIDADVIAQGALRVWRERDHLVRYLIDPENEQAGEAVRQLTPADAVRIFINLNYDSGLTDLYWLGQSPASLHPAAEARLIELIDSPAAA